MDGYSTETLFKGVFSIKQPRSGYRYTLDPILLAHFVRLNGRESVMDLGTGSGIIPLILCHRYPHLTLWGMEIQDRLAALARTNIIDNNLDGRVTIIHGDLAHPPSLPPRGSMDHVLANPPYIPHKAGRLNPSDEKAVARHEIRVNLDQVISSASYLLKDAGRLSLVFPHNREQELFAKLKDAGFSPQTLRRVHPLAQGPCKRILVESIKHHKASLSVLSPLVIFQAKNQYSDEVKKMFE